VGGRWGVGVDGWIAFYTREEFDFVRWEGEVVYSCVVVVWW